EVHALHQTLGQQEVVVWDEGHATARLGATDELDPLPDHLLAQPVGRMRLPGDDELYWAAFAGQDPEQPIRVAEKQVRPLVGGEPTSESEHERVRVQGRALHGDLLRRDLHRGELLRHPLPDIVDKTLTATGAYAPELGIGSAGQFFLDRLQRAAPALGARPSGPERVGLSGVTRGRVHAVGDVS